MLSDRSTANLETCHPHLQKVIRMVAEELPLEVICGYRNQEDQDKAYNTGRSKLQFPESKHNSSPSKAVDIIPENVDWNDHHRFCYYAGWILAAALRIGIKLRWGGDWNRNHNLRDQKFFDLVHFELVDE